ncbi:hypothetical protein GLOTRDRAFT_134034 [Gloeophyllum trabeum ATCC 11539]|uniref:RNI-like protein n=1 Tax=Gloeophyllum trabeum (strain ATCC 11539 / FP-39264 / Madison 617) TaxID=670483 RepID=S7PSK2_GLOTA|nr:uncharacterized protein GLOTRDRAFT_134034 [Gloeophyllum trabeum ATCC 11539]EPQ50367.1 hypothetical protein GLOTRDRAFT_134034 [Gloeophyllum trabeum ATCC 11539]
MQSVIADYLPMVERTPEEYRECSLVDDGRRYGSDVKWSSEVVGAREHELGTALRRMQNLHQFRWFRPLPPVSTGEDDLWTILKSLGTVRALHILDLHEKCLPSWPSVVASSSFLSFCGLTSLTLRSEAMDRISEDPDVTPLLQMLVSNCPALENVRLHLHLFTHIETAPADVMVRDGQWPNLTSLYLEGFNCQPTDLAIFLGRHSGLRELRLPCMMPGYRWKDLVLPSGSLPNLRTLECHSPTASALLSNGEVATNLVTLQAIDLHDVVRLAEYFKWDYEWEDEHDLEILELQREIPSPWKAQLLEGIRAHPSITWLELDKEPSHSQVAELAEVAPQITELSFCGDYDRKKREWNVGMKLEIILLVWYLCLKTQIDPTMPSNRWGREWWIGRRTFLDHR